MAISRSRPLTFLSALAGLTALFTTATPATPAAAADRVYAKKWTREGTVCNLVTGAIRYKSGTLVFIATNRARRWTRSTGCNSNTHLYAGHTLQAMLEKWRTTTGRWEECKFMNTSTRGAWYVTDDRAYSSLPCGSGYYRVEVAGVSSYNGTIVPGRVTTESIYLSY